MNGSPTLSKRPQAVKQPDPLGRIAEALERLADVAERDEKRVAARALAAIERPRLRSV